MKYKITYRIHFSIYKSKNGDCIFLDPVSRIDKSCKIIPKTDIFSEEEIYFNMFKASKHLYLPIKNTSKGVLNTLLVDIHKIISEEELFYLKLLGIDLNSYEIKRIKNG